MSGSTSPFRTRTALILIAVGVAAMLGFLLVNAYGDRFEGQRGNTPSPVSRYATGFHALYRLVELSGGQPSLAGIRGDRRHDGLLILTPNIGTQPGELAKALASGEGPKLIVLPKWITLPQQARSGREERFGLLPPQRLANILRNVADVTVQQETAPPLRYPSDLALTPFQAAEMVQSVSGRQLVPLIATPGGEAVLAQVKGTNTYILADPDLINNLGLAHRRNARAAIAMLAALAPDSPGTVAFDTMLPFGAGNRSLTQLMFEAPFVGVTIALLAAALMAGMATLIRFGPARREPRALPFGKRALIENIVSLARRAGRTREGGTAFADMIRDWIARRLSLPRGLQGEALDAHLDSLKTPTPYASWSARLRDAKTEAEMLQAAQKLDDWRKEAKA